MRSCGGQLNSNQSPEASPISSRMTGSSTKRLSNVPERMLAAERPARQSVAGDEVAAVRAQPVEHRAGAVRQRHVAELLRGARRARARAAT